MSDTSIKSFHSLTLENPGFATDPRFWTANHLSMVNCSFQEIETDEAHDFGALDSRAAESLAYSAKKVAVTAALFGSRFPWADNLLYRNDRGPITSSESPLTFHYGRRRVRLADSNVHTYRIKEEISIPHADPMIGYYEYRADEERREKLRAPRPPRGLNNDPVQRKYDIRYHMVAPKDWRHDPFLVCILLSLAQLQRRKAYGPRGLFLARLLVTNQADTTNAYVYKADIPYQLLESLDCPTRSIEDFDFPPVNYVKIPFEPYLTFSDRIHVHLAGMEYSSPGPVLSNQVVPPQSQEKKRKKRKRHDESRSGRQRRHIA
ncbi:hypothetical protein FGADI_12037 [Fusarium gaditjirri]|uniref:Uncharacterized protein n=1 Tax=Fusarium gaditjirri TaxID=282569 RepID=A0A8H4STJ3_9HYPO|nr:hypothetical protein FGADI_12037 [Fusarium gaditjirri]